MSFDTAVVVAHPWLCDVMGHMNARHIFAGFDDAGMILLNRLGLFPDATASKDEGWADVRAEVDFRHEIQAGTVLRVRSVISRIGRASFTHRHEMLSGAALCHASAEVTSVRFDLVRRKAIPLPKQFAETAAPWLSDVAEEKAADGIR